MGLEHGAYCVGCCSVLMLLLFVGGVMNLVWVAVIAIFVLATEDDARRAESSPGLQVPPSCSAASS